MQIHDWQDALNQFIIRFDSNLAKISKAETDCIYIKFRLICKYETIIFDDRTFL